MKVAAIQHDIVWEDPAANHARLGPRVSEAVEQGARLVVFSEMYSTGFSMDSDRIAESRGGPSEQFLVDQAIAHRVWVCGSLAERTPDRELPTNTFVLATPDGGVHRYAKIHPFSYAGEHERYAAGDRPVTIELDGLRVSPFVCYDLRFGPEFWALADRTDCYVVVANWPASRREHWRVLVRARAIENQAYVVAVNRVGHGGGLDYVGDSQVVDPLGNVLADAPPRAGAGYEALLLADVDRDVVRATRERYPFLADRGA